MMDFASTTQAELEAERGELQARSSLSDMNARFVILFTDQAFHG